MEVKASFILKKLEKYLSIKKRQTKSPTTKIFTKSKSWHSNTSKSAANKESYKYKKADGKTPNGCFSVYVGQEKQRFVIKTEFANHPLFKMLLEDAELEYGFNNEGPLLVPCEVDLFRKILAQIEGGDEDQFDEEVVAAPLGPKVGIRIAFSRQRARTRLLILERITKIIREV